MSGVTVKVKTNDKAWVAIERQVLRVADRKTAVKVGVFNHSAHTNSKIPLDELAALLEFGNDTAGGTMPARSYLRSTMREKRREITTVAFNATRALLAGRIDSDTMFDDLGEFVANLVRRKIVEDSIPPPLRPETVRRKGHDHPLIDTRELLENITWQRSRR